MNTSPHTVRRLAAAIGLAASLVAFAVPAAFAGAQSSAIIDGRSPDTRDAALAAVEGSLKPSLTASSDTLDPAIAAAIAAHEGSLTPVDRRSPDTRDAAIAARQGSLAPADARSRRIIGAGVEALGPVETLVGPEGFDWADFGIGLAAAAGAMLVLVGLGAGARAARRGRGPKSGSATAA
jgi:hypothetical protein